MSAGYRAGRAQTITLRSSGSIPRRTESVVTNPRARRTRRGGGRFSGGGAASVRVRPRLPTSSATALTRYSWPTIASVTASMRPEITAGREVAVPERRERHEAEVDEVDPVRVVPSARRTAASNVADRPEHVGEEDAGEQVDAQRTGDGREVDAVVGEQAADDRRRAGQREEGAHEDRSALADRVAEHDRDDDGRRSATPTNDGRDQQEAPVHARRAEDDEERHPLERDAHEPARRRRRH